MKPRGKAVSLRPSLSRGSGRLSRAFPESRFEPGAARDTYRQLGHFVAFPWVEAGAGAGPPKNLENSCLTIDERKDFNVLRLGGKGLSLTLLKRLSCRDQAFESKDSKKWKNGKKFFHTTEKSGR